MKILLTILIISLSMPVFADCPEQVSRFAKPTTEEGKAFIRRVKKLCPLYVEYFKNTLKYPNQGYFVETPAFICRNREDFVYIFNRLVNGAQYSWYDIANYESCEVITWASMAMLLTSPKDNKVVEIVYNPEFDNREIRIGWTYFGYLPKWEKRASMEVR